MSGGKRRIRLGFVVFVIFGGLYSDEIFADFIEYGLFLTLYFSECRGQSVEVGVPF